MKFLDHEIENYNFSVKYQTPFDYGIKSDYAVTIQIPAFKKVNYNGIYKEYAKFSEEMQKELLLDYLSKSLAGIQKNEVYFEKHKDGRYHLHTYFKHIEYDEIYKMQNHFCAEILRLRPKQFQQVFNFFTPDDFHFWMTYCQKEQPTDLDADLAELEARLK